MKLFLCRHGNTFNPGDDTVWTGSSNDLPLVEKGEQQAHDVATWLKKDGLKPDIIFASHLQRVTRFAEIISQDNGYEATIDYDARLNEIDYGSWTGITDREVIDLYGEAPIQAWRQRSEFPAQGQWGETEEEVTNRIDAFVTSLKQDYKGKTVFVVSSNGILRFFLKAFSRSLYQTHIETADFQVKTGRMCLLEIDDKDQPDVVFWNKDPNL